jgi:hypothetical protein
LMKRIALLEFIDRQPAPRTALTLVLCGVLLQHLFYLVEADSLPWMVLAKQRK